jgi:hypothetical protein
MLIALFRVIAMFALLTSLAALPAMAATIEDGPDARYGLQRQVLQLLEKGDFAALEKQAEQLRQERTRFTDGGLKLNSFYEAFDRSRNFKRSDSDWLQLIADLEAWNRAYPLSITARTALAWGWYGYGWFARGGGYADTVTDEGWKLYRDRLTRAAELAKEPGKPADCPERYHLLLNVARGQSADDETYAQLFRAAVTFDPDYHYYYLEKAGNLLPRWGGAPGAVLRFAEETIKQAPAGMGNITYARIVSFMQENGEIEDFKQSGVSWPILRAGFRDQMFRYPGSDWIANRFALFACLAEDREVFLELVNVDGFLYRHQAWPEAKYDACRVKYGLPSLREISDQQMKKHLQQLEEKIFKEMVGKAEKGEPIAMGMVGEMYAYGRGVARDDVKAYAWLVLAGDHRELLEEVTKRLSPDQAGQGRQEVERLKGRITAGR